MPRFLSTERIAPHIRRIRGHRVMLDSALAVLYGVPTKVLNQAVKRHWKRFPSDFMFRLNATETRIWRSQIVTSNPSTIMGLRRPPYAFTEQGVAMLSSVLNTERAIRVNVAIMRAFVKLRRVLASHGVLAKRLGMIERQLAEHDDSLGKHAGQIRAVFRAIRELMALPEPAKSPIGFRPT